MSGKHSGGAITKSSFGVMSLRDNVAFFFDILSPYFILLAIVHTKISYELRCFYINPITIVYTNKTISYLAVGCKHTGYKSLMAGLATEWIYDAFAGKSSFICMTFFFTRLYELTNLVLTL